MCFYFKDHVNQETPLVADKDILCYKVLNRFNDDKHFKSLHQGFKYSRGKTYEIPAFGADHDLIKDPGVGALINVHVITQGFHSFDSLGRAVSDADRLRWSSTMICWSSTMICLFVIPKGTEYFYNSDAGEYVSKKIIFVDRHYNNWRQQVSEMLRPLKFIFE